MFLYQINYSDERKELCELEIKRLFSEPLKEIIITKKDYEASRSTFIKTKLDILVNDENKNNFLDKIKEVTFKKFKVAYIKTKKDALNYNERIQLVKDVASNVQGIGCLDEDATQLGVVYVNGVYYFGLMSQDHQTWQTHQNKPQSYSQSLSANDARSLVNIATGGNDLKIVDPCCGVGTVVLEALSMGHAIDAYEIHLGVAWKGNRNLEYFGYPKIIHNQDMHTIEKSYDVAILDIPYNLYSSITKEEQYALIQSCHRIASNLVLISFEDLENMLLEARFRIIDKCYLKKMKFGRYIYYCERKNQ